MKKKNPAAKSWFSRRSTSEPPRDSDYKRLFVVVSNLPPSFAFEELGLTFVSENMIGMLGGGGSGMGRAGAEDGVPEEADAGN